MTIWFDMDGTIADLYGVKDWLPKLRNHDATPYVDAMPLIRLCTFARVLHKLQDKGYFIGIISWLSKDKSVSYAEEVTKAKEKWLAQHLPSVFWDEIHIIPYGTPKSTYAKEQDVLFDDEFNNRKEWTRNCGLAYDEKNILEILKNY